MTEPSVLVTGEYPSSPEPNPPSTPVSDMEKPGESKMVSLAESLDYKLQGNHEFGLGHYEEAIRLYTLALELRPEDPADPKHKSVLLSNRAAAFIKIGIKENYESAIADCTKALEFDDGNMKALLRRAKLNEMIENLEDALVDYKALAERDRSIPGVMEALMRLPHQIEEKNEKMKTEMLGKLKDLGNLVLKPFGLSTNNFKMEPQSSGGYSVKFEPTASKK